MSIGWRRSAVNREAQRKTDPEAGLQLLKSFLQGSAFFLNLIGDKRITDGELY